MCTGAVKLVGPAQVLGRSAPDAPGLDVSADLTELGRTVSPRLSLSAQRTC